MTNNTDVLIKQESKKEAEQVTRFTQGLNLKQQDLFLTFLRGVLSFFVLLLSAILIEWQFFVNSFWNVHKSFRVRF